jgi:hypothetical protein
MYVIGVTRRAHHKQSSASLRFRVSSLRYSFSMFIASIRFALVILVCAFSVAQAQTYKYFRLGNPGDVETKAKFGIAMMGGAAIWTRRSAGSVTKGMAEIFSFCAPRETTTTTRTSTAYAKPTPW